MRGKPGLPWYAIYDRDCRRLVYNGQSLRAAAGAWVGKARFHGQGSTPTVAGRRARAAAQQTEGENQ